MNTALRYWFMGRVGTLVTLMFLIFTSNSEAAVSLTPGAVEVTDIFEVSRWEPVPSVVNDSAISTSGFKILNLDGSTTFVGAGSWVLRYPHTLFGDGGIFPAISKFDFAVFIATSGNPPEVVFRYLWGPGGSNASFDAVAFTRVNGDNWAGKILSPPTLGDPFGFEVVTYCSRTPCSSSVTPYFAFSAPIPEPKVWALLLVGGTLIAFSLRRQDQMKRSKI